MKRNIGSVIGLYPAPIVVIGAMVGGKPNWLVVGHHGIIGHDRIMMSLASAHYTNAGIKESKVLSVNIVDEAMLEKADAVGRVSGREVDKSGAFAYSLGDMGAPMIDESPLTMECTVEDVYETADFESFILKIAGTYVKDEMLDESGKISYRKLKPILFEMPTYEYLSTGDVLGKCMQLGNAQG